MYEDFFGLSEKPFALTPNPRFVFQSEQYRAAGEALLYGIAQKEGFMLVTGHPGTGKTTLCRDLLEKLDPARHSVALMFNPFLNGVEMLQTLLTEFGVRHVKSTSRKELIDLLNAYLFTQLAEGRTCIAIFDEAQHLGSEFLEQIRVLSNLETDQEKLIQIILVGQPELLQLIRTPKMAQLDQRVSVRCTLSHLNRVQTERYIYHRLNVAGAQGRIEFASAALKKIFAVTNGIPRLINLICDRCLLAGYAAQTRKLKLAHVNESLGALRGEDFGDATSPASGKSGPRRVGQRWSTALLAAALLLAIGIGAAEWKGNLLSELLPSPPSVSPSPAPLNPTADALPAVPPVATTDTTTPASAALFDSSSVAAAVDSSETAAVVTPTGTLLQTPQAPAIPTEPTAFGVQVAGPWGLAEATQLRDTLASRGYSVAVAPCAARHCVRIGPFETRTEAREVNSSLSVKGIQGVVVGWGQR